MITDGDALQVEVAAFVGDFDQREVGGTATDIADEDELAGGNPVAPVFVVGLQPGVEGGLWFLQQGDFEPSLLGGLHGHVAGHRVEGGGDREDDVLFLEFRFGVVGADAVVPGVTQVFEEPLGGGHG